MARHSLAPGWFDDDLHVPAKSGQAFLTLLDRDIDAGVNVQPLPEDSAQFMPAQLSLHPDVDLDEDCVSVFFRPATSIGVRLQPVFLGSQLKA